jgi:3'(2'), 5'-bisphosphate nucleotidase
LVDLELLTRVAAIGLLAARRILELSAAESAVHKKADGSPVTQADLQAHRIIVDRLNAEGWSVVSEEDAATVAAKHTPYFLVDPLDGTREYIAGHAHYTVNLALIEDHSPTLGVIVVPACGTLYLALNPRADKASAAWRIDLGDGLHTPDRALVGRTAHTPQELDAWVSVLADTHWQLIRCCLVDADQHPGGAQGRRWRALASASNLDARTSAWLAQHGVNQVERYGSALKFCILAEGGAEVYPRFAPTMEWDTAAGQAIVEAAGGSVCLPDGSPLRYGKSAWRNGDFVAWGNRDLAA